MVITTAQLHSTKPELRLRAGSNPAGGVSEICDGEDDPGNDLTMVLAGNKAKCLSSVNHTPKTIHQFNSVIPCSKSESLLHRYGKQLMAQKSHKE